MTNCSVVIFISVQARHRVGLGVKATSGRAEYGAEECVVRSMDQAQLILEKSRQSCTVATVGASTLRTEHRASGCSGHVDWGVARRDNGQTERHPSCGSPQCQVLGTIVSQHAYRQEGRNLVQCCAWANSIRYLHENMAGSSRGDDAQSRRCVGVSQIVTNLDRVTDSSAAPTLNRQGRVAKERNSKGGSFRPTNL